MSTTARLTPAMRRYLAAYVTAYDALIASLVDAPVEETAGPYVDRAALHASGVAIREATQSNRGGARTDLLNRLRLAGLVEYRELGRRRINANYSHPVYGYVLTADGRAAAEATQ